MLTNDLEGIAIPLGIWFAGGCAVSLPLPARGVDLTRYVATLGKILAESTASVVVASLPMAQLLRHVDLEARIFAVDEVSVADGPIELPPDDEAVFVQYSSGSTSEPRGCVLTGRVIARQLSALSLALEIDPERDVGVVWLPLSHDMGLFGCLLLTYWTGHPLVLSTPERFLGVPHSWMDDCGYFGATVSASPNFGLELAARTARLGVNQPVPMRKLVVGGEKVHPETVQRACDALGPERLGVKAVMPAYGLAEAVLAVSMTEVGAGPRTLRVGKEALAEGRVDIADQADATTMLMSAGRPLPHCRVEITGEGVGEILVRSDSLATGYLGKAALTSERFTSAGLRTGDYGFMHGGELYVTGREDDLIVVAGRNIYAADIEETLASSRDLRPGSYAVVDASGGVTPSLTLVAELREQHRDEREVAREAGELVFGAVGIRLAECVFVSRGRFPKTPSGKIQRFRCRAIACDSEWPRYSPR